MTLFGGLGFLFGIPLSTALGRRPVLLCAAITTIMSTFWAGAAGSFDELVIALGFQALAFGTSIGMVCGYIHLLKSPCLTYLVHPHSH